MPNFGEIAQNAAEILWFFHFSRWRPSAILDWFYACWDHPRRVLGGLWDCAKFGGNRCRIFDGMQILIFSTLSWKMPIHAPKIGVFGGFYPQNGEQYERDPKRHILGRKHVVWRNRSSKSVHVCGLGASRSIMQKKCVVIPAARLYIPSFIEIRSRLLEPQGVKIWPFPLLWLVAFTTACTTVQAVIEVVFQFTTKERA